MDSYSAIFPNVPSANVTKNIWLWLENYTITLAKFLALVSVIEYLWYLISNLGLHTSLWRGWVIFYISSTCFNNIIFIKYKYSQFRKIKALSITKNIWKIIHAEGYIALLYSYLNGVVSCILLMGINNVVA